MAKPSSVFVALLRGINVGGKNELPMKELTTLFQQAGCVEVRSYIQSGNMIFRVTATVSGREIFLHCPDGIGRSKLTVAYFERTLGTTTTLRNWRTVGKLVELATM